MWYSRLMRDGSNSAKNLSSKWSANGARSSKAWKTISMFSGCGGMDLGFTGGFQFGKHRYHRLPFEIVWANDVDAGACVTYKHNLQHSIHCGDVWDLMGTLPRRTDVVIGGFPCQDVSINGVRAAENGVRSTLYKAMQEVIQRTNPRVFVAENVKGILMSHSNIFYQEMMHEFDAIGYKVKQHLYLAADYGVPQMRERVLFVGTRKKAKSFQHPAPILPESKWMSSREALADLEHTPHCKEFSHIWSSAKISPEQGYRKIRSERPSTTIRAECHGNMQFHYELQRRLSLREAARLQSFPDNFKFMCGMRQTERQIGNAVPPVLAWHVAHAVQEHLK